MFPVTISRYRHHLSSAMLVGLACLLASVVHGAAAFAAPEGPCAAAPAAAHEPRQTRFASRFDADGTLTTVQLGAARFPVVVERQRPDGTLVGYAETEDGSAIAYSLTRAAVLTNGERAHAAVVELARARDELAPLAVAVSTPPLSGPAAQLDAVASRDD